VKGWTGLALFAIGAWLAYSGLAQRGRVISARRGAAARGLPAEGPPLSPSLAMMGEIFPPMICTALVLVGVKMSLVYAMVGENRLFSLLDLAGFLALLAGYGTWIVCTTKFRELKGIEAPATAARQAGVVSQHGNEGARRDDVEHAGPAGADPGVRRRAGAGALGAAVGQREEAA
jgi:hypothetical protein